MDFLRKLTSELLDALPSEPVTAIAQSPSSVLGVGDQPVDETQRVTVKALGQAG